MEREGKPVARSKKPRYNEDQLDKLELSYLTQLPTVAALMAATHEEPDADVAAREAIELMYAILERLEGEEEL